jgi:hypothetical protein
MGYRVQSCILEKSFTVNSAVARGGSPLSGAAAPTAPPSSTPKYENLPSLKTEGRNFFLPSVLRYGVVMGNGAAFTHED